MAKQIAYNKAALDGMLSGIDQMANTVKVTLGPKGKNVVMSSKFGAPVVTNSGLQISKEMELEEAYENMGVTLIRDVVSKTNEAVGDGTTTTVVLAQRLLQEGVRNLSSGANPILMRKGMERAAKAASDAIAQNAIAVCGSQEIAHVASVSGGSEEIGRIVAEAIDQVTAAGIINVEASNTAETRLDIVEGMHFDRGYVSPYMVTDADHMQSVVDDPVILITDKKIASVQELFPVLEQVSGAGLKLVIIAEDIEGDALSTVLVNQLRGRMTCVCIKAPGYGDRRRALLMDMAVLTGATFVSKELNMRISDVTLGDLGRARQVKVTHDSTVIVGGFGSRAAIDARIVEIQNMLAAATSEFDVEHLQERLAKMTGGVAVIRVGAVTEVEAKEKMEHYESAIHSARAALEEGVVAGGGAAFLHALPAVHGLIKTLSGDEKTGAQIVAGALEAPIQQIAENAGLDGSSVAAAVRSKNNPVYGYDVQNECYCDMIQTGIIDPTKVVRVALENAVSVASSILTVEATVAE